MKIAYSFFCAALLTVTLSLSVHQAKGFDSTVVAQSGVADATQVNFTGRSVALNGIWSFARQQLLTPKDTAVFTSFTRFPQLWNNTTEDGKQLSARGYATYGLKILLPKKHGPLALYVPVLYTSYKLFVNGEVMAENGVPATSKENYSTHWVPLTINLPATDTLNLMMQVANFSHAKGGPNLSVEIGDSKYLQLEKDRSISCDFLLAGCLFMGGLFFLGLYMFGSRDKATLYFSLFCMLYSYRMVGSANYALHAVVPGIDWEIAIRLEYISLFGSIFLFLQYVLNLYPQDFNKTIMKLLSGTCLAGSLLPVVSPSTIFTQVINPFLVLMFFCIGYLLFVFIKAYTKRRVAAEYALMSIAIIMIVQLTMNLEYFGIYIPSRLVLFAGYVIFFFLQSLILSFRFAYTLQLARKQAEQGLQAKSEFLSTMSHEIRTPLNSVIGMSNLMLTNNPRPDQKEQLDVLQFSAKNLLSIVNDILDYNKIEAGKISFEYLEMDIAEILGNIAAGAKIAADEKGIDLTLKTDAALTEYIIGDPTRLAQVMHNLVGNAVKFTKAGGVKVELTITEKKDDKIKLQFKVKDSGIGIAKDKQQLIFEEFTQADSSTSRSFGGTGLGLAITKRILSLQGSRLQVESEPGQGATFFFEQEFATSGKKLVKQELTEVLPSKKSRPLAGANILLVEDNQINILVAKTFLESWGATIDVAENGLIALEKLDQERHQLVLMDLHMPVMDGYTAIKKIREKGIDIPIIALTASLPGEVESEIKGLEINGFVLKPFVPDELFKKVLHYSKPEPVGMA